MTWKSWRKYAAPLLEYGSYFVPVGSVAVGMYKAAEQMQQDEAARVAKEEQQEAELRQLNVAVGSAMDRLGAEALAEQKLQEAVLRENARRAAALQQKPKESGD